MSGSGSVLTIKTADTVSEIAVLDGRQERVAQGLGQLQLELSPALYKVRVRVGSAVSEQLVSLDQDRTIEFGATELSFPTPVPLAGTSRSHEYHQQAATEASARTPNVRLGEGATILVFARDWSPQGTAKGEPMADLTLHDAGGQLLLRLEEVAVARATGDVCAGSKIALTPGAYRLRLKLFDGTASERSIIAVEDWQTQVFMLMRDFGSEGQRRADLAGGAIVMSRGQFDPSGRGERAAAVARYALTQNRKIAQAVYNELFTLKFEDPILGLLAAHLLLRDSPEKSDLIDEVLRNLASLLGKDHPDLQALRLRRSGETGGHPFRWPPLLRASWDLTTVASVTTTVAIPQGSPVDSIETLVLPTVPWLVWRVDGGDPADLASARARKVAALMDFLRSHDATWRAAMDRSGVRESSSPIDSRGVRSDSLPLERPAGASWQRDRVPQRGRDQRAVAALAGLDNDVKAELTRSLGVTNSTLESMLEESTRGKLISS